MAVLRNAELTKPAIDAFFKVYNELGYGFREHLYEKALEIVLRERGVPVRSQQPYEVFFHGERLGVLRADLIVNDCVVVELKAGSALPPGCRAQVLSYLKASGLRVGLVLFFGPVPEVIRVVMGEAVRPASREVVGEELDGG